MRPLGGGGTMAIGPMTVLMTVLATTGRLGVGVQKTSTTVAAFRLPAY